MLKPPDLDSLRAAWRSVARYTVYRSEASDAGGGRSKRVLFTNQTWDNAQQKVVAAEAKLRIELGYRPNVMCRPLIGIELERSVATREEYLANHK